MLHCEFDQDGGEGGDGVMRQGELGVVLRVPLARSWEFNSVRPNSELQGRKTTLMTLARLGFAGESDQLPVGRDVVVFGFELFDAGEHFGAEGGVGLF